MVAEKDIELVELKRQRKISKRTYYIHAELLKRRLRQKNARKRELAEEVRKSRTARRLMVSALKKVTITEKMLEDALSLKAQ